MDPYQAPQAPSRDEELPPRRYLHGLVGALSGFALVFLMVVADRSGADAAQFLVIGALCAAIAGLMLLSVRQLGLGWAALIGPPLTIAVQMLLGVVAGFLGMSL
jgi:hypothetical protein